MHSLASDHGTAVKPPIRWKYEMCAIRNCAARALDAILIPGEEIVSTVPYDPVTKYTSAQRKAEFTYLFADTMIWSEAIDDVPKVRNRGNVRCWCFYFLSRPRCAALGGVKQSLLSL